MSPASTTPGTIWNAACMRREMPVSYMPPIHTLMPRAFAIRTNCSAGWMPPNFPILSA